MQKYQTITIFGCGGVGSWLAEFIVRNKLTKVLKLVDFDKIELKNLTRQNFRILEEHSPKASILQQHLRNIYREKVEDEPIILAYERKIIEDIDLTGFEKDEVAILATDNVKSKQLIGNHFPIKLIINCDKNFVEVKNYMDDEEIKAWDMGGGYSNNQDIVSNLYAVNLAYYVLTSGWLSNGRIHYKQKIEENWNNMLRAR